MAILINKNTPLEILDTVTDPSGCYVFINCRIFSEQWSLLNLYAPNYDDELFVQEIFLKVAGGQQNILIGGDFNFRLDPTLEKRLRPSPGQKQPRPLKHTVYERSQFNRQLEADAPSDSGLLLLCMPL